MIRIAEPIKSFTEALDLCRSGITGNENLRQRVTAATEELHGQAQLYEKLGKSGELYKINSFLDNGTNDPIVIGKIKKEELIKLYENYFVKSCKPAREIYDALMSAADEKCPFCGGIGQPKNLDHYLPKAHFPQFSIVPVNLIPSCRDCNLDSKHDRFATTEDEQSIHPYLDDDCYFNEQWLYAKYLPSINNEPDVIEYFVDPPKHWKLSQQKRVENHFNDFNLSLKFSKEASSRIHTLLTQYKKMLDIDIDKEECKDIIFKSAIDNSPFINHWERVMCLTLMDEL